MEKDNCGYACNYYGFSDGFLYGSDSCNSKLSIAYGNRLRTATDKKVKIKITKNQ